VHLLNWLQRAGASAISMNRLVRVAAPMMMLGRGNDRSRCVFQFASRPNMVRKTTLQQIGTGGVMQDGTTFAID
jgi:hypothetical protein